jgi:hypothetical protein
LFYCCTIISSKKVKRFTEHYAAVGNMKGIFWQPLLILIPSEFRQTFHLLLIYFGVRWRYWAANTNPDRTDTNLFFSLFFFFVVVSSSAVNRYDQSAPIHSVSERL